MSIRGLTFAVTLVALLVGRPTWALTNQPEVTAESTAPRKSTVTWDVPSEVDTNGKTIASWQLDLSEDINFTQVDTFSYAPDALEAFLTRSHGLRGMKLYYVQVRALYTDSTTSSFGSTYFYTRIGKLKQLRVNQTGIIGTATLKWKKPTREGNTLTYNVRLYRKGRVVFKDSVYGKNNLTVTGLKPGKTYRFKVRARNDSKYGKGVWSDLKKFVSES